MAKILVIHELQSNTERVKTSLEPLGHEVISVTALDQARDVLGHVAVDLVISAVHFKEGNVFEFLKWVRAEGGIIPSRFVFFCAEPTLFAKHVSGAIQTAGELLGASKYIMMDEFDMEEFRRQIKDTLDECSPTASERERVLWQREKDLMRREKLVVEREKGLKNRTEIRNVERSENGGAEVAVIKLHDKRAGKKPKAAARQITGGDSNGKNGA